MNGLNIKSLLLKVSTPMEKEYMGKSSSVNAQNGNESSREDKDSDPAPLANSKKSFPSQRGSSRGSSSSRRIDDEVMNPTNHGNHQIPHQSMNNI